MSVPPLRKWRPGCSFHRIRGYGWGFYVHPHRDYNPIFVFSRWAGRWAIEIGHWRVA